MKTFGAQIRKRAPKGPKSITYTTFSQRVSQKSKNLIKPVETQFLKKQKCVAKYLIKPVVYDVFWVHFYKML